MPAHPRRNPASPADQLLADGADGPAGFFPDRDTCKHADLDECVRVIAVPSALGPGQLLYHSWCRLVGSLGVSLRLPPGRQ
jgi:hypothetical protein